MEADKLENEKRENGGKECRRIKKGKEIQREKKKEEVTEIWVKQIK